MLKPVPDDCRYAGGLNPAIADRLGRVRDLPHARVATLLGVVRGCEPGSAYTVWTHVEGRPFDAGPLTAETFPPLARGLASAVDLLHARGLVHGAISPGNVILTPAGDVWLTDLSPYLWDDPAVDAAAVLDLLTPAAQRLGLAVPPATVPMREWSGWWTATGTTVSPPADRRRWTAGMLAAAVVVTVVVIALLWRARVTASGQ